MRGALNKTNLWMSCSLVVIAVTLGACLHGSGGGGVDTNDPQSGGSGGDSGQWTQAAGIDGGPVSALAVDPVTSSTLYAGSYRGGISKSTNGGVTWSRLNTGITNTIDVLVVDPNVPSTLYAGTYRGVFKSSDSGTTWSAANAGLTTLDVYALIVHPAIPGTLYAGTDGGGVFKSVNGGAAWTAANVGLTSDILSVHALAIDLSTPVTLYAGTEGGGVFKSTNGGATWSEANTGLTTANSGVVTAFVSSLAVDLATPGTVYVSTYGGAFRSSDRGGGVECSQKWPVSCQWHSH